MLTLQQTEISLEPGDFLSREEFLARWETMPNLKHAELIGGIVYMPSPVGFDHADYDSDLIALLKTYALRTHGCHSANNATWIMLQDAPQPDCFLRFEEDFGGHSFRDGTYLSGAPELAVEISNSSASYDLHQKRDLYEEAGVDEYLVLLPRIHEARWYQRRNGELCEVAIPADGIIRSGVFPGLWLDVVSLLNGQSSRALDVVLSGIASTEHAEFVAELQRRKRSTQ